mgnify:CR=1 FL=1
MILLTSTRLLALLHENENSELKGIDCAYTVVSRGKTLGRAIRTQRYRYTSWSTGEELYDLEADPFEENNLVRSKDTRPLLDEMRQRLIQVEIKANAKKR